jgi:orotidine-5'-phosphate decarboxylase
MTGNERVIVALDFEIADEALRLVERLGPSAVSYKVGLQLLTAEGPAIVRQLVARGKQVFLDLKLHEIPNSVAGAVTAAGNLGASMVTVHASAGAAAMKAAVDAARPFPGLSVLAVTVITSLGEQGLGEIGVIGSVPDQVERLAMLAVAAGCQGIVASPQEAARLRQVLPAATLIVTPGIQLSAGVATDQLRTADPASAMRAGATHVVIGRSITTAGDPCLAYAQACDQVNRSMTPTPSATATWSAR